MAKNKISEFSSTPVNNTDIGGINIAEGCAPSGINNAIRELMAQLKDQQSGTDGDNFTVGGNLAVTGTTTLTGVATAPTPTFADSTTKIATTAFVQAAITAAVVSLELLHPVGSIYINASNSTNPATLFGFGTWVAFGAGRVPVGFNAANPLFDTAEETGGSADSVVVSHTHTATVTDPGHAHSYTVSSSNAGTSSGPTAVFNLSSSSSTSSASTGISVSNSTAGVSGTNGNYQPFITVYMWKRTA